MISNEATPTISIIIPVYQVAPYLRACLDSVIEQSFTDWEMLLVDDGSTDGSEKICDEYAEKDARIHAYHHNKNQGVSVARNKGVKYAKGEYIAMIDSDDLLLNRDYLRLLYNAATQNDAEISACDIHFIRHDDMFGFMEAEHPHVEIISGRNVFVKPKRDISKLCVPYAKLYHRNCFNGISYPEGKVLEDMQASHHLVYPCKRIAIIDVALYGRRTRDGSITTSTPGAVLYKDALFALNDRLAYFKERGDKKAVIETERFLADHQFYLYCRSLEDGSVNSIPANIMPDMDYFERRYSYATILNSFRKNDPTAKTTQVRSYQSLIAKDALHLLLLSTRIVLKQSLPDEFPVSRTRQMEIMSRYEDLPVFLHEAVIQHDINKPPQKNRHIESLQASIRNSIIYLDSIKRIHEEMDKLGIPFIQFLPEELTALYSEPWFMGEHSRFYIIKENDIPTIRKIMERMSFVEKATDPLESERNTEWTFEHSDGTRITFITGIPCCFFGKYKKYMDSLFEKLLSEKRSMTLTEYAVVLIAKLHPGNHIYASARLRDILDLSLILKKMPTISEDHSLRTTLSSLSLADTFDRFIPVCKKTIQGSNLSYYSHEEGKLVFDIISRPHIRLSFLKRESHHYLEEDTLYDPHQYAIIGAKKLAYLVNCKAACSSIIATISEMGDNVWYSDYNQSPPDANTIHRLAELLGLLHEDLNPDEAAFFTFTFVRNPFIRLISCYENKYHANGVHRIFEEYLWGYMTQDEGFETFVKRVCALPYRMMDRHFRRQHDLVYDKNGNRRCEYVGHFETLEEDFAFIRKQYGLSDLPHLNSTGTHNWMDYYTCETAELVYRTFEKDFISFGYEYSYHELMSYLKK